MKRSQPMEAAPLDDIQSALDVAASCIKRARRQVRRLVQDNQRQANAHRRPCRGQRRKARHAGPQRIVPGHEYTPDQLPPVGERWVHIGDGTFVPLRVYKRQQREYRHSVPWND